MHLDYRARKTNKWTLDRACLNNHQAQTVATFLTSTMGVDIWPGADDSVAVEFPCRGGESVAPGVDVPCVGLCRGSIQDVVCDT